MQHYNSLQHTTSHCNVLQRTATHCNALQRTATHLGDTWCTTVAVLRDSTGAESVGLGVGETGEEDGEEGGGGVKQRVVFEGCMFARNSAASGGGVAVEAGGRVLFDRFHVCLCVYIYI